MNFSKMFSMVLVFALTVFSTMAFAATELRKGQIVYGHNGNHLVGEVKNIFGAKAEINWILKNGENYIGGLSYWDVSALSAQVSCHAQVCGGVMVYGHNRYGHNRYDLVGQAVRVFENGIVEVNWMLLNGESRTGNLNYWTSDALSPQVHCAKNICAGDRVYGHNGNDLVGNVQRMFLNGVAELRWDLKNGLPFTNNKNNYWDASYLQKMNP